MSDVKPPTPSADFFNNAVRHCRKKLATARGKDSYTAEGLIQSFAGDERTLYKLMCLLPVETFRLLHMLNGSMKGYSLKYCPYPVVRELYVLIRERDDGTA